MAMGLTERQSECLEFIKWFRAERGHVPTYEQICVGMGFKSRSNAHVLMIALKERGYVTWIKGKRGSLALIEDAPACPHCGNLAGSDACIKAAQNMRVNAFKARAAEIIREVRA